MDRKKQYLIISTILLIFCSLIISGCVEVTPESGTQNASAYANVGSEGNMTSMVDQKNPGQNDYQNQSSSTTGTQGQTESNSGDSSAKGPEGKILTPPDQGVVQVTPRSLEGLPVSPDTQSSPGYSKPAAISPGEELVTIYEMNHSFVNDAIAYAYTLENPPIFVDIQFSPEMGTDVISYQKRTGDKEGQIDVSVNRPLKDSWFEMRVYNQKDGSEVLREGYGKTYSQSNKTFALRSSGSYQFDMVGNRLNATIKLKVPRNLADISMFQNVSGMIADQKQDDGKIPGVFLITADLPAGWEAVGDTTRTSTNYQSVFKKDYITLRQKIARFDSTDIALSELEKLKASGGSGSSPSLVGQSGFQIDSASKSQVAFVQGLYLVELSSFSAPDHVSLSDLQGYGKIIVTKINSGQ